MTGQGAGQGSMATGFGYFILRLRLAPSGEAPTCTGMIERLGTGEKRSFETADELLNLIGAWPGDGSKMP